jgi:hypothetical protein
MAMAPNGQAAGSAADKSAESVPGTCYGSASLLSTSLAPMLATLMTRIRSSGANMSRLVRTGRSPTRFHFRAIRRSIRRRSSKGSQPAWASR